MEKNKTKKIEKVVLVILNNFQTNNNDTPDKKSFELSIKNALIHDLGKFYLLECYGNYIFYNIL